MTRITIDARRKGAVINRNIYGHFSEHLGRCIYQGMFVGEDSPIPNEKGMRADVVAALKNIRVPVLRWPGGCFADEYHWRDGVGPQEKRRRMVNTNWGGVVEDNSFGTHEFMELCRQIGCEPYVNANVGSGTVQEMAEWVEYLNSDSDSTVAQERRANGHDKAYGVTYWGVGNENWGCGGNMRPEFYADVYRRYQTYCRSYGDNKLFKIACGASDFNYEWTRVLMERAARYFDGLTLHYYTVTGDWAHKGSATAFTADEYYTTLFKASRMDELVTGHSQIMDRYDPEKRVALIVDEWGTWHDVEPGTNPGFLYQQNTMRDALVAAITLNIFNRHADRVRMANLAQTVNVLQSVVLTEGSKLVLTPTYHVFDLYKAHQDAELVDCYVETGDVGVEGACVRQVSASASVKDGALTLTAANASCDAPAEIEIELNGIEANAVCGRILTGRMDAKNDFDETNVEIQPFMAIERTDKGLKLTLPACAVAEITVK